ncbi:putative membrane protein [Sphaerochaeta pleomorpha str. Grapes]|uniref:Putative membrane protein n=1 Tax=Sphaerochaeta pleomorpha (strain ATCC BAA-1885 / DSM 22778 / Grapes) TaxID=158190 RepID=G8QUB3_SPHPG|nr:membrane protein [Sphaerochaeta pleomorpha]AEV28083.1 putative membrane protein [Sphaerochaeta pleomorpha str. Grapes]
MRRYSERLARLFFGLFLYGLGIVITMKANIGYAPWEVFHAGVGLALGQKIGIISIFVGFFFCGIALLLGEKLGIGTVFNMIFVGIVIDFLLSFENFYSAQNFLVGIVQLIIGLFVISIASFFYISSAFGAGPRDSLMVALARKTKLPVGVCRGAIELLAVFCGWLLGGKVGLGTVISALMIGFCIQVTFKVFRFDPTKLTHEDFHSTIGKAVSFLR